MATAAAKEVVPTTNPLRELFGITSPDASLDWVDIFLYGEPGSGKTEFLGTADDHPDTRPVLILDIEGGTKTLRRKKGIDVVQVRDVNKLMAIHKKLHENPGLYKTVGFDSLSELQRLDMVQILARTKAVIEGKQDAEVASQREWQILQSRMRKIVRAFRDLPCNTIFTSHVDILKDKEGNIMGYAPLMPGKLKQELPGFIDVVGFLYTQQDGKGDIKRVIQFAKTPKVMAKDRFATFGDKIEEPTIPMLWEMIHDEKGN